MYVCETGVNFIFYVLELMFSTSQSTYYIKKMLFKKSWYVLKCIYFKPVFPKLGDGDTGTIQEGAVVASGRWLKTGDDERIKMRRK